MQIAMDPWQNTRFSLAMADSFGSSRVLIRTEQCRSNFAACFPFGASASTFARSVAGMVGLFAEAKFDASEGTMCLRAI